MFAFLTAAPLSATVRRIPRVGCPARLRPSHHAVPHHPPQLHPRFSVYAAASTRKVPTKVPAIMRPMVPSADLLSCGLEDRAQPRSEVLKSLWNYIKLNKLQDADDGRVVHCDANLKSAFGVNTCRMVDIPKLISSHLRPAEDVGGVYLEQAAEAEREYIARKTEELRIDKPEQTRKTARKSKSVNRKAGPAAFKPIVLSDDLAAICNAKEMTRPAVLKSVWTYIRMNNLQATPGAPVRCDFQLKKVFKTDEVNARTIMGGISSHMTKKE